MPQFVIEREMPGAGSLGPDDLKGASQASCSVLRDMGPQIQWVHSYVTDNKIYCIYRAPDAEMIRQHAESAGRKVAKPADIVKLQSGAFHAFGHRDRPALGQSFAD